jgi:hypothetical protein
MSFDRIYGIPTADAVWQPDPELPDYLPQPPQSALIATNATDSAYLVGNLGFAAFDALPTGYIVGSWSNVTGLQEGESWDGQTVIGTPTHPVTIDYTDWVRLLGNDAGRATGFLDSTRWAGHVEQKYLQTDHRYTDALDPFVLTITRDDNNYPEWLDPTTYDTGDKVTWEGQGYQSQQTNNQGKEPGAPGSDPWWAVTESGYGWTATMIEPSASQDPITGYNIRVYPTAECVPGDQIYTSGNFSGDPPTTSATSNHWTPNADAVHMALIFVGGGNSQNGIITLDVGQDTVTAEFWEADQ